MKHLKSMTVRKAETEPVADTASLLEQIFGFVLNLVDIKGKSAMPTPY